MSHSTRADILTVLFHNGDSRTFNDVHYRVTWNRLAVTDTDGHLQEYDRWDIDEIQATASHAVPTPAT